MVDAQLAADERLVSVLQTLCSRNDDVVRACNDASHEVQWVAASQSKAKDSAAEDLNQAFNPQVLSVLKRSADQLAELKRQHIAEKQAAKDTAKKLMWFNSGQPSSAAADDLQADAVKHGRFKFFTLPGSGISAGAQPAAAHGANASAAALKFWHTGLPAGASVPRSFSDTPSAGDQHPQSQKSITAMLFGKSRRSSSSSSAAAANPASRRGSDAGGSWRSSADGSATASSRRVSSRSSDSGNLRSSASLSLAQPPAAAAVLGQDQGSGGGVWASLAGGEGPLSKSHSLLAKHGVQQEQMVMVGKTLEMVTEDEREGRDSPQPGTVPRGSQQAAVAAGTSHLRLQIAGGRSSSPIESFSFGNRADDEQAHSPNFMRASVSSRLVDSRGAFSGELGAAAAGPLVRSSLALQASLVSRVDPFDAPEPQPQPFVEQMKLEDQAMKQAGNAAKEAGASSSFIGALRRSIGGAAARAGISGTASAGGGFRRQDSRGQASLDAGMGPLGGAASNKQQQPQQVPTAGEQVSFLDLDATRAYAIGVQQVMEGLVHNITSIHSSGSEEEHSQPESPRGAAEAAATAAAAAIQRTTANNAALAPTAGDAASPGATKLVARHISSEIVPAAEEPEQQQRRSSSNEGMQECRQQQLEQQSSQRKLAPPSPSLSPQSSGMMPPMPQAVAAAQQGQQQQQQQQMSGLPPPPAGLRVLRPSQSSASGSRRQSHAASTGPSSPTRGLPVMGQACMDILQRQPPSLHRDSKQLVGSSSASVKLTDVYNQTSGNLTPLAAGLSSIRRQSSSSHGSRTLPPRGPGSRTSPRSLLPESSLPSSLLPAPTVGPLAQQYSRTMQHAKKSAQAAGLAAASPREVAGRKSPWGWQSLGLPTGPGAPLSDPTIDPATYVSGNKYAASWGLVDAAATAAAQGGLSHQASAISGGLSRQSSAINGALSRQASAISQRQSPRYLPEQQQQQQTPGARQQWQQQHGAAAGRYAGPASVTPTECQSPRSGGGTPGRGSDSSRSPRGVTAAAAAAAAIGAGQRRAAGNTPPRSGFVQSRRISDAGSDDSACYASAEENMSTGSSLSGYASSSGLAAGPSSGSGHGAWAHAGGSSGQRTGGRLGASPVPAPPQFLQRAPTTAQAAVAAQWSPNKHASAIAQAPAYALMHVSPEASGVNYGEGQGLSPHGLPAQQSQGLLGQPSSSRVAAAAPAGSGPRGSAANQQQQQQQTAYAGGYTIQTAPSAPSAAAAAAPAKQQGPAPGRVQPPQQQQQQQRQGVVTAVDMARKASVRRSSSSGSHQHGSQAEGNAGRAAYASGYGYGAGRR